MNLIPRIYDSLGEKLKENRVVVLYGPRRVGKTTLVKNLLKHSNLKYQLFTGEELHIREAINSESIQIIKNFVGTSELIVIDEAQQIPNVGQGLKLMVDHIEGIKVLITGSASLDLSYKVGEPLTGRKYDYTLYPISQLELSKQLTPFETQTNLEKYMVFGSYPEVLTSELNIEKEKILRELINSFLLKDILELERVKGARVLMDLLRLLAFQIGSEVSLNELGNKLNIDVKTIDRYLDLFEKSFIIYKVNGYSRNLRNEVRSKAKYYFLDNGIRNAIIENFNDLNKRNDVGQLWENFVVSERLKKQEYAHIGSKNNDYFWRTWDRHEIDWVEMRDGKLFGYEIKWNKDAKSKGKTKWLSTYSEAEFETINQGNYLVFLT